MRVTSSLRLLLAALSAAAGSASFHPGSRGGAAAAVAPPPPGVRPPPASEARATATATTSLSGVRDKLKKMVGMSPPPPSPRVEYVDENMADVFKRNLEWKKSKEAEDPDFFKKLGTTHQPPYMWIGCSDARVPANEIIGEDAGSVFTIRNVANMVVNTDFNLMSALQYAVGVLKVQHIIVCGHYECGGVKASMANVDHEGSLENWLRNIRDVYRIHRRELDAIEDDDARHRRLVELNAVEQCINVFKTGAVQRRRVETYKNVLDGTQPYTTPRIHGMVFDPKDGKIRKLKVNFGDYIDDLRSIYDLYELEVDS